MKRYEENEILLTAYPEDAECSQETPLTSSSATDTTPVRNSDPLQRKGSDADSWPPRSSPDVVSDKDETRQAAVSRLLKRGDRIRIRFKHDGYLPMCGVFMGTHEDICGVNVQFMEWRSGQIMSFDESLIYIEKLRDEK